MKVEDLFHLLFLGGWEGGRGGVDKVGREEEVNLFCFLFLSLAFSSRILILSKYCLFVKKCCLDFYRAR